MDTETMEDFGMEDMREMELETLKAVFPELVYLSRDPLTAVLELEVTPDTPIPVKFLASPEAGDATNPVVSVSHFPPLRVEMTLPVGYPEDKPPVMTLSAYWVSKTKLKELEELSTSLWEEMDHDQMLYAFVDALQEKTHTAFDIQTSPKATISMPYDWKESLTESDAATEKEIFENKTWSCGICLYDKKGTECYRMERCGHVSCRQCLQDFFHDAVTRGEYDSVKCVDLDCPVHPIWDGKGKTNARLLSPKELLKILQPDMVKRYVEIKRKKQMESDTLLSWCPRKWCQGAEKSPKYPKYENATQLDYSDIIEDLGPQGAPEEQLDITYDHSIGTDRLRICEDCNFAYCRVCSGGWHGDYVRCGPRDVKDLSAEEQASLDFIAAHTTPCPTCKVPIQKKDGCNHVTCFQCKGHFCYLCAAWLDPANPYKHFNDTRNKCYGRLFDGIEGDNGEGGDIQFVGRRAAAQLAERYELEWLEHANHPDEDDE